LTPALPPLFGKTLDELRDLAVSWDLKPFVGNQLALGLYQRRLATFAEMTDLSKPLRERLEASFSVGLTAPSKVDASIDGTRKYLFPAAGRFVEAAYIPDDDRKTLCLSSQVGCKMGCLFCMTGKQGFQANLSPNEILNQVRSLPEGAELTNVVYMGMGEPLDNLENTLKSLETLTADWGFGLGVQRVTVSSIGLLPALETFFSRTRVRFALSLHNPFEDERRQLLPVQNVHALSDILAFLKTIQKTDARRLSIEYIAFDGVNDTPRHVKELVRILHGLKIRVNLIRFHPIPGTPLGGSSEAALVKMRDALNEKGVPTTIRRSRGQDIYAACGLLSTKALLKPTPALEDF
jgi:23S rRNA (adenine2503-C2)-methyltransferase